MNYIGYYRVSTEEQGKSGLGLAAQREAVLSFIDRNGKLVQEFSDIESGASLTRRGLLEAIELAKETGSTIVVKETSRINRADDYEIMNLLKKSGVEYIESASPFDPEIVKAIKAELAKEELRKVKKRTKDALDQIKKNIEENGFHITKDGKKITSLGSPKNLSKEAIKKSAEVRKEKALTNENNIKAGALIIALRDSGIPYPQIAKKLNDKGFKTSRGSKFTRIQAQRLYSMFKYR